MKKELTNTRKHAEKAERLLQALTDASSSSPSFESSAKRVQRAEIARDEAESRRRAVLENWMQLNRWLQMVDLRNQEARRLGGFMTLGFIGTPLQGTSSMAPPPPPTSQPPRRHATRTPFPALPPPTTSSSTTTTSRRARTPSLESKYTHPPSKRSCGNGEPGMSYSDLHIHLEQHGYPPPTPSAPRIIMSPGDHHKPHPHTLPSSHLHLHSTSPSCAFA